jgi:hypothetical protein
MFPQGENKGQVEGRRIKGNEEAKIRATQARPPPQGQEGLHFKIDQNLLILSLQF